MVDWSIIGGFEGAALTGYVPTKDGAPLGASGVTIASGVDLGQMSRAQIGALPVSVSLRRRLLPYAGIKGAFAQRTLANAPLTISQTDADALDAAVQADRVALLRKRYDDAVSVRGLATFDELGAIEQTVIASVSFQYGNLAATCPRFWAACVDQDWSAAVAELLDFGDDFSTRRHAEADLLKAALG